MNVRENQVAPWRTSRARVKQEARVTPDPGSGRARRSAGRPRAALGAAPGRIGISGASTRPSGHGRHSPSAGGDTGARVLASFGRRRSGPQRLAPGAAALSAHGNEVQGVHPGLGPRGGGGARPGRGGATGRGGGHREGAGPRPWRQNANMAPERLRSRALSAFKLRGLLLRG